MLVALSAAGIAQNKTGSIQEGLTSLSRPFVFTTADSIAGRGGYFIKAGETYYVTVTNPQKYLQTQAITSTVLENSGSGWSILITLYGKVNSGDGWTSIGTPVTWTSNSSNPVTIANTTPANYNFLKLAYVAAGGTYSAKITALTFKTANAFPYGSTVITGTAGETVTGGVVSLNASSNYAVNIGTGTTTSTVTIGGAGAQTIALGNGAAAKTVALGSSNTTSTTTILSGSNAVNINAANNQPTNINTGSSTGLVTIGGGSGTAAINTSAWGITSAGAMSGFTTAAFSGAITATGGIVTPTASPVIWSKGGSVALSTSGTDSVCSAGRRYFVEVDIPYNVTLTGLAYLVGSTGGTDSVIVQLYNSAGTSVATSKKIGLHHGDLVGTAAQFQAVDFSATYAAVAGKYFASVQFNGAHAKFRLYPIPGCKFITGVSNGIYDVTGNITPGTSFTADKGPIVMTY